MKIILGSESKGRRELMDDTGLEYVIIPSNYEEDHNLCSNHYELVEKLSEYKGRDVAKYTKGIIITGDSMVSYQGKVFGKPNDKAEAISQLEKFCGNKVSLISGYTIINTRSGEIVKGCVESFVHFKNFNREQIEEYVNSIDYKRLAGSFTISSKIPIVNVIEGSISNVIGLPTEEIIPTVKRMKKENLNILLEEHENLLVNKYKSKNRKDRFRNISIYWGVGVTMVKQLFPLSLLFYSPIPVTLGISKLFNYAYKKNDESLQNFKKNHSKKTNKILDFHEKLYSDYNSKKRIRGYFIDAIIYSPFILGFFNFVFNLGLSLLFYPIAPLTIAPEFHSHFKELNKSKEKLKKFNKEHYL